MATAASGAAAQWRPRCKVTHQAESARATAGTRNLEICSQNACAAPEPTMTLLPRVASLPLRRRRARHGVHGVGALESGRQIPRLALPLKGPKILGKPPLFWEP